MAGMPFECRQVKKALKRSQLPEPFFISRYALSPYQGCTHGCKYCDGRAEKYHVEGLFERDIIIRENMPEVFRSERRFLREKGIISIGSGTTDSYQPVEKKYHITRQLLSEVADTGFPVLVPTKNSLVLEDLDILKDIQSNSLAIVCISITTLNDHVRRKLEPGASSVEQRLDTLAKLKEAGISAGVLAMPVLPGLSDDGRELEAIYRESARRGADFLVPGALTLRPGRQKDLYLQSMENHYRDLLGPVKQLYRSGRQSGSPDFGYTKDLHKRFYHWMKHYKLPALIPHGLFKGKINLCDELFLLLLHMQDLYKWEGVNITPLKKATDRYAEWLIGIRKEMSRRRSLTADYATNLLMHSMDSDKELGHLLGNDKLEKYVKALLNEGELPYLM